MILTFKQDILLFYWFVFKPYKFEKFVQSYLDGMAVKYAIERARTFKRPDKQSIN